MTTTTYIKPSEQIVEAVTTLCRRNGRTQGLEPVEMYLSGNGASGILVIRLAAVVEGECRETDRTIDIQDLWAMGADHE